MTERIVVDEDGDFEITYSEYTQDNGYQESTCYITFEEMEVAFFQAKQIRIDKGLLTGE